MTFRIGNKTFNTVVDYHAYIQTLSPAQKVYRKIALNSHYGATVTAVQSRYYRSHYNRRADEKTATIWRRLFGDKPLRYKDIAGGASISYPSYARVTMAGQQNLRKIRKRYV